MKKFIGSILVLLLVVGMWFYLKPEQEREKNQKKVLITVNESQINGLDPIQVENIYSNHEVSKIYEGLLEYHYLKRPFELIPNLAEAMPTISPDKLVYTFKIKPGIMFHDNPCFPNGKGRELTAHDFVYSLKRLADPKLQARGFWLIDGKIKGLNAWREKYLDTAAIDYMEEIEGLQAIDRYTLQFTLTKPFPQFLYCLAISPCYVVPHEAVQYYGVEFLNHPVGTGPFMLTSFNPKDPKIVYHKNPNFKDQYFPSEAADPYKHMLAYAGKKLPFVDEIITYILPEEQTKWLKFKKGELDMIDISKDRIALNVINNNDLISSLKEQGIQLFQVPGLSTSYIVFNNAHPVFKDNLKLRQAMSLAFNAEGYNTLFYKNMAVAAQSIIPPNLGGYRADYVNPYCLYNLEKAKQYLREAGYPDGKGLPEITLDVMCTTDARHKGEFIQQCMSKIGIHVKIVTNIFPELQKKIDQKATMMHVVGWSGVFPDAENFLQVLYGPYQLTSGGIGTNFNDSTFNALYAKAIVMSDSQEKIKIYEQLNQIAAENVPVIYILHSSHVSLQQGWVKNYCWSSLHFGAEKYIDIDLDQQKALLPKLRR
ncbi:MAG: hypothetical protein BGO68_02590 [Candidatus Amoebophilus sp. 36-38]|nr:MAG: hypothetical protein BGO68_02590 [Candidatus Amoebophilus sp. 36-38]